MNRVFGRTTLVVLIVLGTVFFVRRGYFDRPSGVVSMGAADVSNNEIEPDFTESIDTISVSGKEEVSLNELEAIANFEETPLDFGQNDHNHKLNEWVVEFRPSLKELSIGWVEDDSKTRILDVRGLLGDTVELTRYESVGDGRGVFYGKLAGKENSSVVLGLVNEAVSGSIKEGPGGSTYELRNAGNSKMYIAEIDVASLGTCAACSEGER
ncbi:hypothetical protein MLD52_16430 [Puniceicoccaceae bacterium K14]|nr:hypothetical protein [Puniceicoccaceae bacterium K14]